MAAMMLLAVLGSVGPARADDPQEQQPVGGLEFLDQVHVTVVNVDVFVRDNKGQPVEDLTREDFRLLQDGKPVEITNFAVLSKEVIRHMLAPLGDQEIAAPGPVELPSEIRPVFVVLYVDNENLRPFDRNRVLRRVREFVMENLEPPVEMMVVSYQRSLDVVQPFTRDSRAVNDALRGMTRTTGGRVESDNTRQALIEDLQEAKEGVSGQEGSDGPIALRQRIYQYAEEEASDLGFTLAALRQTIAMLSGVEGRKSIIYISSGLPMTPGLGLMQEYAAVFRDNSVMANRSILDRTRSFHELAAAANAQEVSMYTIDAQGLDTLAGGSAESAYGQDPVSASVASKNYQDSLSYMADATGGIAILNTNDPTAGLVQISEDLFSYYSLGYTLGAADVDRVHRLEVEIPGHPDYELRYRRRFVEKSLETRVQDRVLTSLMVDIDDNPMDLRLTNGAATPVSGNRWTVPLHLSFPLDRIALLPQGEDYVGQVALFIGAQDPEGRSSEMQRQDHEIRIPASDYDTAVRQRFGIDVTLLLEEGRQRVAVGLMDLLTNRASYDRAVVTVP
jgi:VWFA-related protein